jgi:hypothetical protein
MKRRNSSYRFALVAVVAAAAGGCDGQGSTALSMEKRELAECSLSIPADSTALHLQRTVNAVLAAKLDACGGAVDLAQTSPEFLRLDADEQNVHLLFRVVPNRAVPDRTVPDRAVPDHTVLDGAAPDRALLDRVVPSRTVPDGAATLQRQLLD